MLREGLHTPINVAFVNYHDFTSNSAIHIFHLANALVDRGVNCAVCIPGDAATVSAIGRPKFQVVEFPDAQRGRIKFDDASSPTLIHAWTPREIVRELTEDLAARHGWPYVVHLEDHEDAITAETLGLTLEELGAMAVGDLDAHIGPNLTHPMRGHAFLSQSAGVTVILDRLLEVVPAHVQSEVIWPAYEEDLFHPQEADRDLRHALGIRPEERVVVYAGNAHAANVGELRSLYLSVHLINRRGYPTRLIRLGRDFVDVLGTELRALEQFVVHVGFRPRPELPKYFALADILVQPGRSSPFNDYRFPAKLPEFFAMGRPVALPPTNLGRSLDDGENCLLLHEGHAVDIADTMARVFSNPSLAQRLGDAGRLFAEQHFSREESTHRLHAFYDRVTRRLTAPDQRIALERTARRYADYHAPRVSYATVGDYCDSADNLPLLASANHDMKDVQRPWMLKAILGRVARGGRLLEIGAGTPIVADLLARLGYDVWVIDPYDGRDGGPQEFDELRRRYPALRFVRSTFPTGLGDAVEASFDCIYSISVLEHIPSDSLAPVLDGVRRFSRDSQSATIHAIDHVVLGEGAGEHHEKLSQTARGLGVSAEELATTLARIDSDPEVYFLSAEGHHRWRGPTPYDEFPMRRCVSIQLCLPAQPAARRSG